MLRPFKKDRRFHVSGIDCFAFAVIVFTNAGNSLLGMVKYMICDSRSPVCTRSTMQRMFRKTGGEMGLIMHKPGLLSQMMHRIDVRSPTSTHHRPLFKHPLFRCTYQHTAEIWYRASPPLMYSCLYNDRVNRQGASTRLIFAYIKTPLRRETLGSEKSLVVFVTTTPTAIHKQN